MVGPKSTQTRVVGIITDEMYPYTFFIETLSHKVPPNIDPITKPSMGRHM